MNELPKLNSPDNASGKVIRLSAIALAAALTACGGGGQKSMSTPTPAAAQEAQGSTDMVVPDNGGSVDNTTGAELPDNGAQVIEEPAGDNTPDQTVIAGAEDVGCDADPAVFNNTMLAMLNEARIQARSCGDTFHDAVVPLQWNDQLMQAAAVHASDMTRNNFFSHDGSNGLGVSERATSAGYEWRAVGENIAAGQLDVAEAHEGWMDSPGHCRNVMNSLFTEVGAACLSDPATDFGTYWVVVFGDQR